MSGFTESALEKKLVELNNSQQSIQTLSLWLIHHRKHHKSIVQVWFKELKKAKPNRRLTFVYLANDVIQNSKKKGPEFSKEFSTILSKAFQHISPDIDDKTRHGLERVLSVWEDRSVYDSNQIEEFRQALAIKKQTQEPEPLPKKRKVELPVVTSRDDEIQSPRSPPGEPPDPEELIKALQDLENSASTDAAVREKIASLPPEVSDSSLLGKIQGNQVDFQVCEDRGYSLSDQPKITNKETAEKLSKQVDEACSLLADYNSRLSQELEDRKKVSKLLSDFTHSQKEILAQIEQKLEEYRDKLRRVTQVRNELKSHLQNLPDLTLLPSVTGGLAPLPSAGDLFSQR
ncbi:regulation of nuclear pre-mRNA domain-containing protein 1B-like isoform X1 [Centruroides sculpturatus]|uniref:regulation of nuclear pre-mRNA domain-containing protein 1B-like isoform X1 n=1 Tax=Centruroides sculpturatus TaxID=218467 RepID=UPI000C6EFB16|nr:regulation of nuclear pre-mRNA domain-containing protein 1B-like isoform X1 [Centruroides sculpturatus]